MNARAVGGYRLAGTLHTGCCGVSHHLATSPSGRTVVVRHYGRPAERRPDLARLARLREAAPVGAVAVLDAGPDHVVTEYVEGGSLLARLTPAAAAGGPGESGGGAARTRPDTPADGPGDADSDAGSGAVEGAALRRLAIGTVTAVAAAHRAGLAPVGIRPSRVLLGPDGPRLLCAVPEVHDVLSGGHDTSPIDLEPGDLFAPERTRGGELGPATDVWAWAATVAYAAAGRDPFGGDGFGGRLARMAEGAASLAALPQGPLRELLADCLAVDPEVRPTAEQALLRLIEETVLVVPRPVPGPVPGPVPQSAGASAVEAAGAGRKRRRGVVAAAGVVIALVAGGVSAGVTLAVGEPGAGAARVAQQARPGGTWTPRAVAPADGPPAEGAEVPLPGGLGVAYEHPGDRVRLTSVRVGESRRYTRDPRTGRFGDAGPHTVVAEASPDGRYTASFNTLYAAAGDHLAVWFADHLTGERFSVPVLRPPYQSVGLSWSRRGDRLLLSVQRFEKVGEENQPFSAGYVIIDVAARSARFVPTGDGAEVRQAALATGGKVNPLSFYAEYRWMPDGRSVISRYLTAEWGQGVRVRDAESGRVTRMMHWVGHVVGAADMFSPSGGRFVTSGCAKRFAACVWTAAGGARVATVPTRKGAGMVGWYDEEHLIQVVPGDGDRSEVVVTDFAGEVVRVLAELRTPGEPLVDVRYTRG
ncbi:hypothetical protein [Nonomuraea sp. NPDC023979]|uniref:hypothetical protein n=1 Tax=Nonomuraea sp. NPDC023979 TaxID=3154796 RepID=UPI0034091997